MFADPLAAGPGAQANARSLHGAHIYPHEGRTSQRSPAMAMGGAPRPRMGELKREARRQGLWNLFYTHGPEGAAVQTTNTPISAEILGRRWPRRGLQLPTPPELSAIWRSARFATAGAEGALVDAAARRRIRSCFAMTEPALASSDATEHRDLDPPRRRQL